MTLAHRCAPVATLFEHFMQRISLPQRREPLEKGDRRGWVAGRRVEFDDSDVPTADAALHFEEVGHRHGHHGKAAKSRGNNDPARHALWEMRAETDGQECPAGLIDRVTETGHRGLEVHPDAVNHEPECQAEQAHPDYERADEHEWRKRKGDAAPASANRLPHIE